MVQATRAVGLGMDIVFCNRLAVAFRVEAVVVGGHVLIDELGIRNVIDNVCCLAGARAARKNLNRPLESFARDPCGRYPCIALHAVGAIPASGHAFRSASDHP